MEYICIGKFVNTHGIKGEIRILSNFEKKDIVFKSGFIVYIGDTKERYEINSYRPHKNFDMITLKGLDNINDVLKYKGSLIFINREDLNLKSEEFLLTDLIGFQIKKASKSYGTVKDIYETKSSILLLIESNKEYYIPYTKEFITNVDLEAKEIEVERVGELYEI